MAGKKIGKKKPASAKRANREEQDAVDSIGEMRGIGTLESNTSVLLVEGEVEPVAAAVAARRPASTHQRDVIASGAALGTQSFLALRVRGQRWVQVYDQVQFDLVARRMRADRLVADDARSISEVLSTRAMLFQHSDTAAALEYALYDRGVLVERMQTGEGYEIDAFEAPGQTTSRDTIESATDHADALLRTLDACVPGWSFGMFAGRVQMKPGESVDLSPIAPFAERADFVRIT